MEPNKNQQSVANNEQAGGQTGTGSAAPVPATTRPSTPPPNHPLPPPPAPIVNPQPPAASNPQPYTARPATAQVPPVAVQTDRSAQQPASPADNGSLPIATNSKSGSIHPKFGESSKEASEQLKKQVATAQNTLLIAEVRDGLVIMRDGSLRAVVMCQSINFDLMSEQEREGVEQAYQSFLNSLGFTVQIYIRSRRVDLNKYISHLQETNKNQENILLSLLMEDYIAYVQYLIQTSNIMDKQFYIVVPYYPTFQAKQGLSTGLKKLTDVLKPSKQTLTIGENEFERYKTELTQQVQVVLNGLQQMNVQAAPLNTEELIELYYTAYNPQTAVNERLGSIDDLEAPIVTKGQGPADTPLSGEIS